LKNQDIPKEIIDRIKELGLAYCLIHKWPNEPINLSYFSKNEVIRELYGKDQSLKSFVIEVSVKNEDIDFTLWPT